MTTHAPEPAEPGKANHITAAVTATISILFAYVGYA